MEEVLITTGHYVDGYRITAYHGVVRGGSILNLRRKETEEDFDIQMNEILEKMKQKAICNGANAIIGLSQQICMEYNMSARVVDFLGTMVTIQKIE